VPEVACSRLGFEVLLMQESGISFVVVFGKTTDGTRRRAAEAQILMSRVEFLKNSRH
jgi:hypothetical protein